MKIVIINGTAYVTVDDVLEELQKLRETLNKEPEEVNK